jgi:hypothetical protein
MLRRALTALGLAIAFLALASGSELAAQDYNVTGTYGVHGTGNMNRFYHYPYVTYPQNYWSNEYYRSNGDMYHRYPQEMRIPVYNRAWHNYYPSTRRYHWGHHFILDVF